MNIVIPVVLVIGMRASCRHGGSATPRRWGWRGGRKLHAEVSNPMVFTVFSTPADCSCVLVFRADPCWNVSICIAFCASGREQHGIYGDFACFQKAFFSGRSDPMVFIIIFTCWLLLRVVVGPVFILTPAPAL